MSRKRLGIAAIVVGVLLAGAALIGLLSRPGSEAGDVEAVERALLHPPPPTTAVPAQATTSEPSPPPTGPAPEPGVAEADPLWRPNPDSRLDSLADSELSPPVALRIDALDVDAPIGAYGVDERTGQMEIPNSASEVGWYRYGPIPGQTGSAVLAAHVDLAGQGQGVFFRLHELEPGDRIGIRYADGSEAEFVVRARAVYLKTELPLDAIFSRDGPAVLTLVTCGGAFNSSLNHYDSNVVVYASPAVARAPSSMSRAGRQQPTSANGEGSEP